MIGTRPTGRALGRAPFFAAVLALLLVGALTNARPAHGQLDDATPTWWHEAAGLTPLLTAPPPENPATICLIDTGVTPTPDLDITARWAYDGGTLDDVHATEETPGHGTLVAHFAAGKVNGWGGAGAFPHARISSVRVFPRNGGASWREYIAAISRCSKLDPNTKVIVISIGGQEIEPGEAEELEHWIGRARDRHGVSVVVAAGNGGGQVDLPGRFASAFTVSGIGASGERCAFSASGPEVDIAAPGCELVHGGWSGTPWAVEGTSFAAATVAGALAAVRSYDGSLDPRRAENLIARLSGGPGPPVLDAAAALRAMGVAPGPTPSPAAEPMYGPAAVSVPGAPSAQRETERLPTPRVRTHRLARGVALRVVNRPAKAYLEIALDPRRLLSRAKRIRLRTARVSARCRFVDGSSRSRWIRVRW
ncbi:MAG TPA: S8/S53 family peptidase [Solirubrobacteraceae bacterium]|nr:S8/S53 family peptidase [Solirubrobacteraceae bacterium]